MKGCCLIRDSMSTAGVSCGGGKSPVDACSEGKGFRGGWGGLGIPPRSCMLHVQDDDSILWKRRISGNAQTRGRREGVVVIVPCASIDLNAVLDISIQSY